MREGREENDAIASRNHTRFNSYVWNSNGIGIGWNLEYLDSSWNRRYFRST